MPVRKIPKNYLGVTGAFASLKNGRALGFESLLERDYMLLLEFDPDVESFEEQPVRIPVAHADRRATTYVPDLLIRYRAKPNGAPRKPALVEVKKRAELERKKAAFAPKFAAAKALAEREGWRFLTVTEIDIRIPRLGNLKFLREYALIEPDTRLIRYLLDTIAAHASGVSIADLLNQTCSSDADRLTRQPVLWHLLITGAAMTDLNQPLGEASVISLPKGGQRR